MTRSILLVLSALVTTLVIAGCVPSGGARSATGPGNGVSGDPFPRQPDDDD